MLRIALYLFALAAIATHGFSVAQRLIERANQQLVALDAVQYQLVQQVSQQPAQPAQPAQSQLIDLGLPL